jgi:hypothetical protein
MKAMNVRLHAGYGNNAILHKIVLDDVDVSNGFNFCQLTMRAGDLAVLELGAPVIENGWVGGEVAVQILPATREALIALGWTPPQDKPEIQVEGCAAPVSCNTSGCVDGCPHAL